MAAGPGLLHQSGLLPSPGFLRAFQNNIFGGDLQGGSTITQRYVKNALVGDQRTGLRGSGP